jgi:hypothetical protein
MEAVGISDKRGLTWTPQPERTLTTLYLHRPTRCSPRPSPDSSFASSFQQATDLLSHGPSVHGWRVCAQPIQPPLLVTLRAGGDGTTGLVESVLE